MPKKKEPDLTPKEQFRRFEEAAKEGEVDVKKAEYAFERVSKTSPIIKKLTSPPE